MIGLLLVILVLLVCFYLIITHVTPAVLPANMVMIGNAIIALIFILLILSSAGIVHL